MTPDCFNGYKNNKPCYRWIAHRMSQRCKAWATGDRAVPAPALDKWQCAGCAWLPEEARGYLEAKLIDYINEAHLAIALQVGHAEPR